MCRVRAFVARAGVCVCVSERSRVHRVFIVHLVCIVFALCVFYARLSVCFVFCVFSVLSVLCVLCVRCLEQRHNVGERKKLKRDNF